MAYRNHLQKYPYSAEYPSGLGAFLQSDPRVDKSLKYSFPEPKKVNCERRKKRPQKYSNDKLRLPARLDSPLVPYPAEVVLYYKRRQVPEFNPLQNSIDSGLRRMFTILTLCGFHDHVPDKPFTSSMRDVKMLLKLDLGIPSSLIHTAAMSYAQRATQHDLSIAALRNMPEVPIACPKPTFIQWPLLIQRMRNMLTIQEPLLDTQVTRLSDCQEGYMMQVLGDGGYIFSFRCEDYNYAIITLSNHVLFSHSDADSVVVMPHEYFDYLYTIGDITTNLEIMFSMEEYRELRPFVDVLIDLMEPSLDHNTVVNFMKSLEGFLLNISDYDPEYAYNWDPLCDAAFGLWRLDIDLCGPLYEFGDIMLATTRVRCPQRPKGYLMRILHSIYDISRAKVQELSSLHKFIFFAEVDAQAGVNKFLSRVHTPRPSQPGALQMMIWLMRYQFCLNYYDRHKVPPNLVGSADKVDEVQRCLSNNRQDQLRARPLSWWADIIPCNSIDDIDTDDALEFAKDKGSLTSVIRHTEGDSKKELLQVVDQPDYKLKSITQHFPFQRLPPEVIVTTSSDEPCSRKFHARLIEKEREQKVEARLFANAELENKHGLSVVASKLKKVLGYFKGQMMTPQDKERKRMLHESAQLLIDPNKYAVMLDLEGHNQSMQFSNTGDLLEACGLLYGEEGWGDIANYFSNLEVYHYDKYIDRVTISRGQLGGIEGWLNPLWTLHTTLMMQLLEYMADVAFDALHVYGDDVAAVITINRATESKLTYIFNTISDHCLKFGMVAKMSQTTLSPHRITMLRQHYYKGERTDSTLKRLLATSGANNAMIVSDAEETKSISSSVSSAMEFSSHTTTCCVLKHYKEFLLNHRLTYMLLQGDKARGLLAMDGLPTELASLLYQVKDDATYYAQSGRSSVHRGVWNDMREYLRSIGRSPVCSDPYQLFPELYSPSLDKSKFLDSPHRLLYAHIYSDFLNDLLFYCLYIPEGLGGLGATLHLNMMLSGHSEGMTKILHYMHQWAIHYSSDAKWFCKALETALTLEHIEGHTSTAQTIINSVWPSKQNVTPVTTSINTAIEHMIRDRARNTNVIRLFNQFDSAKYLYDHLLEVFRHNFHTRVVQFYIENSVLHFVGLFLRKIETSSGLLYEVSRLGKVRRNAASRHIVNLRRAFTSHSINFGVIDTKTNIVDYLHARRAKYYPAVTFIDSNEILYDDLLTPCPFRDATFSVVRTSPKYISGGRELYTTPNLGNETLYKGEFLDNERLFGSKEEYLMAKLTSVTKWLCTKAGIVDIKTMDESHLDCVVACKSCLATLSTKRFCDLAVYCATNVSGEVLHRIPNSRFATDTTIRSEVMRSLGFTTQMNQKTISELGLVDSNLNFEYIMRRLVAAMVVRDVTQSTKQNLLPMKFARLNSVRDVQFVTPKAITIDPLSHPAPYQDFRGHKFKEYRYRLIALSYLTIENEADLAYAVPEEATIESERLQLSIADMIMTQYRHRLDLEYMIASHSLIADELWEPILPRLEQVWVTIRGLGKSQQVQRVKERLIELDVKRGQLYRHTSQKIAITIMYQRAMSWLADNGYTSLLMDNLAGVVARQAHIRETISQKLQLAPSWEGLPANAKVDLRRLTSEDMNCKGDIDDLLQSLILQYALDCRARYQAKGGYHTLDMSQAIADIRSGKISLAALDLYSPLLRWAIYFIGLHRVITYLLSHTEDLISILVDMEMELEAPDLIIAESLPSQSSVKNSSHPDIDSAAALDIRYGLFELTIPADEDVTPFERAVKFAAFASSIASHPTCYDSPTGSDSYIAQLGLLSCLIEDGYPLRSKSVCDLTAGRGDGCYALDKLGIAHTSYARKDVFTQYKHHPDIVFLDDYDVTDTSTLKQFMGHDFWLIDVSFLGHSNRDLSDLIIYLVTNELDFAIRLNSLDITAILQALQQLRHQGTFFFSAPISATSKPYHIYLVYAAPPTRPLVQAACPNVLSAADLVVGIYTSLFMRPFRMYTANRESLNSVTVTIPNMPTRASAIVELATDAVTIEEQKLLKWYKDSGPTAGIIYYSSIHIAPAHPLPALCSMDKIQSTTSPVYATYNNDDFGNVKDTTMKYHREHLKTLQADGPRKTVILPHRDNYGMYEYFSVHHPLRHVRMTCRNVLRVLHVHETLEDWYTTLSSRAPSLNEDDAMPLPNRGRIDLKRACGLLILAASEADVSAGYSMAHLLFTQRVIRRPAYLRTLQCYRLLTGLFGDIENLIQTNCIPLKTLTNIRSFLTVTAPREGRQRLRGADEDSDNGEPLDEHLERLRDEILTGFDLEAFSTALLSQVEEHGTACDIDFGTGKISYAQLGEFLNLDIDISAAIEDYANEHSLSVDKFGRYIMPFDSVENEVINDEDFDLL